MKKTLLVVDDEPTFCTLVFEVAERHGFEACIATTSGDFQRAYTKDRPGIAIIDMVMPELDGFELIKWLAGQDHRCPLIFMTGHQPAYVRQAATLARTAGLDVAGTLRKPFKARDLSDVIENSFS